jgi:GT2 family glycosyltransferase
MQGGREGISLFLVHWNQPEECAQTVRALCRQGVPLKITIVDNNSALEAYRALRESVDPGINILRSPKNNGWGPALNIVLRQWLSTQRDPFCFISAHDAKPAPDCLRLLLDAARSDARIGIVSPQYPNAIVPRLSALRGIYYEAGAPTKRGAVQYVPAPHGTLFLLRRECLTQIGLFDERYFAYGDEHDLGIRADRSGWKVALAGGAIVTNPTTGTPSAWRSYFFARNSLLLVHDHFGSLAACSRAALILINTLRLVFSRDKTFAFSAKARWRAVRDYFAGRFGPPRWP